MDARFDAPRLELREQRPTASTLVVEVSGEIHVSTAPELRARLARAIGDRAGDVVLDLAGVAFIDSTGLGVLLDGQRQVERAGGRLLLVVTNPTVLRLFHVTHLDATFDIRPTRAAALA